MSDDPHRKPTIAEVARVANVARSTVSRAFAKPERLSKETVAHVLEVARQIGFSPNPVARALSTGKSRIIGLIVPDIANPFFPPLFQAAQHKAEDADFDVFLGDSNENPQREKKLLTRFSRQVDGIILASPRLPAEQIKANTYNLPIVLINQDFPGTVRVLIDSGQGIAQAVEHLAGLGHVKIAYLGGPAKSWAQRRRSTAARRTAAKSGIEIAAIPTAKVTYETGRAAALEIIKTGATATVAFDDLLAQGLMAGLIEQGVRVPEDFSVIGCDDVIGEKASPPLTTISNSTSEAAALAVSLMLSILDGSPSTDARHVLGTKLVVRQSTAPPPGAPMGASRT